MADKKLVEKTIYSDIIDCLEGNLEDAIGFIKSIPETHKDFQDFRFEVDYCYESTNLSLKGNRIETDKEFKDRLKTEKREREKEKERKEKELERERKQYERLKKKFEK